MIPLKDDNPRRSFPFVTYLIIAVNVLVFFHQIRLPANLAQKFIYTYGAVPYQIINGHNLQSMLTSMFLHGGLLHLGGNMLYLYIFGDNIESLCGHIRFFFFYLLCGLLAFASHFVLDPGSSVPMVGASGAISGVLGAYAVRFPRARVHVLIPLFIWIWRIFAIPAAIVLGFWFIMQLFSALMSGPGAGGVAWFAHIGGFIAGLILIRSFEKNRYYIRF